MEMLPLEIEMEDINKQLEISSEPLTVILKQESDRYNKLLEVVTRSLVSLQRGIEGLELISEELEIVMYAIDENKVPGIWGKCYHSTKPLMSWILDFYRRI
jgi:dynein heavy chain